MPSEHRKTLLIVEDQALIAEIEKTSLESYGYTVLTANSGGQALNIMSEANSVDLVLMDITLGAGLDGTEVARHILRTHDIPLIFLSSYTTPEVVEKTESITSYGYVVKKSGITVLDASIKMAFKLFDANRKTKEANEKLESALKTNHDLLSELQHRVKNSFSMIQSMVHLTADSQSSTEAKATLAEMDGRIKCVSELYSMLYSAHSFNEVALGEYCSRIATPLVGLAGNITVKTQLENPNVPVKLAAPIGLILTELITNAIKYAFPDKRQGTITILLNKQVDNISLEIQDDGIGLPEGFDISASTGIGLALVQALSHQIDGTLRMDSDSKGTRCMLEIRQD